MDFIIGLPITISKHNLIMVVVDKLLKEYHFIHVKSTYETSDMTSILMKDMFRLYEIPKAIVSNRVVKFTSNFWKKVVSRFGYLVEILYSLPSSNTWSNKYGESSAS